MASTADKRFPFSFIGIFGWFGGMAIRTLPGEWILSTGFWADNGSWIDTSFWID
jgi:hypothetical protein